LFIYSFEGEKTKGMYHGEGIANYTGGHVYKVTYNSTILNKKTWYVFSTKRRSS
jgi:hypothetical protein